MTTRHFSYKSYNKLLTWCLFLSSLLFSSLHAQCPTVTNNTQSFCDVESILVGDLVAIDNGGGIVWYESAISTTPLLNGESLIDGEDYYADDNTGSCGARQRVDVTILGPPIGQNFQGVCLDDTSVATIADLVAVGNNVQWYTSATSTIPLSDSTVLIDDFIYYADQENPDSGCRTSRLQVQVNVGFTPVPTGDSIQEFCNSPSSIPTVADLSASGTNNWYISLFSALPLDPTTTLFDGQIYYASTTDPPCESDARLAVLVLLTDSPDPGTDGTIELCETDSSVDLFTVLGGTPDSGGTWSPPLNSGTGLFDPSIDLANTYTYTVEGIPPCDDTSATVTVTLAPPPDAGENGSVEVCSNGDIIFLFDFLQGTPELGGTWSPALTSGTDEFNPALDPAVVYTYTIAGIPPCGDATATVAVTIVPEPDAGENGSVELCSNGDIIFLSDFLQGTPQPGGTWSPALASGTDEFNPAVDSANTYTYTVAGIPPCEDDSATVTVVITPEPDAGENGSVEVCDNGDVISLFDFLLGTPQSGGTWSPALASGTDEFNPAIDSADVYTYTVAGSPPCDDDSATVTVTFIPAPDAGENGSVEVCSNGDILFLFDFLQGTPQPGGTWSPALASGTDEFNPAVDPADIYTYTLVGITPCEDSASVTVTLIPEADAGENGSVEVCTNDDIIFLFDFLQGTPQAGGVWSPALASGTDEFNPAIDAANTYTYTVAGIPPCDEDSATVTVTNVPQADAGENGSVEVCINGDIIFLFDFLQGTPQPGGTWSPALTSGTDEFDPAIDPADIYTYSVAGSPPCEDASATVEVSLATEPDAGEDGFAEVCNTGGVVFLFDFLQGTPQAGGTWSPALASGTDEFDPSIDAADTYTYTVGGVPPCDVDSATVEVTIITSIADAGEDGFVDVCSNGDTIFLFDFLQGTPQAGGTWSPALASGTDEFDPAIDSADVYTYSVTDIAPCDDVSATVTVTIIPEPDAGENGSVEVCDNGDNIFLFDFLQGTPQAGGIWSPALASNTDEFNPAVDNADTYTYTVAGIPPCDEDSATVTVTIIPGPDAGENGSVEVCSNAAVIRLFDFLEGNPESGGTWSPALASGTDEFNPSVDPANTYTYTVPGIPPCDDASATVTVTITPEPDAGLDNAVAICSDDGITDLFDFLGPTADSGGTWFPALNSGTGLFDPTIDPEDTYTYTVISSECNLRDVSTVTVTINEKPDVTGAIITAVPSICLGSDILVDISGATALADGNYTIDYIITGANNVSNTIDIAVSDGSSSFLILSDFITNSGISIISITGFYFEGESCNGDTDLIASLEITVLETQTPQISEEGNEFCLQDDPTISDLSSNILDSEPIIWYDSSEDGTAYSESDPLVDGTIYYAALQGANGCESFIRLEVTVSVIECIVDLIIPDGFSPNNDGINDDFNIVNLDILYPNFKLSVYNRYGNILYEGDINSQRWDGTSKSNDRILPIGVYFFILEFNDGELEPIQGRVYLSR